MILWILAAHLVLSSNGDFVYLGLLYGPLFLSVAFRITAREINKSILFLHAFPFIVFTTVFYTTEKGQELDFLLCINIVLMYAYSVFFYFLKKRDGEWHNQNWLLFCRVFLALFATILLMTFIANNFGFPFNFSPNFAIIILLLISILFVTKVLIFDERHPKKNEVKVVTTGGHCHLTNEVKEKSIEKIEAYFKNNKHFLDPCFDFDTFSREVQIPKIVLSTVINKVMNKNFYLLLAEYRINHAKNLLIEQDHLFKIESVIYECGFNSKSSFHKYFKQLEGTTPSCFRDRHFSTVDKTNLKYSK